MNRIATASLRITSGLSKASTLGDLADIQDSGQFSTPGFTASPGKPHFHRVRIVSLWKSCTAKANKPVSMNTSAIAIHKISR